MKCSKCGFDNNEGSKFCQGCGTPLQPVPVTQKPKKAWYKRWWIWLLMGLGTIILLFNATCTCALLMPSTGQQSISTANSSTASEPQSEAEKKTEAPTENNTEKSTEQSSVSATEITAEEIIKGIVQQGYEEVSPATLYQHYEKYDGKKVVTAIKVTSTAYQTLYSEMDKDAFLTDLYFSFDNSKDIKNAKEGDYAIVYGTGDGLAIFGDYREFKHCVVASVGEQAKIEYDNLLRKGSTEEKKIQEESSQASAAGKKAYLDSCETIDYATLARNPDKYKGKHYKFKGKVIQVMDSDSWFSDATTLRVNVTQSKEEYLEDFWEDTILCTVTIPKGSDRILEDDIITFYGDCDGLYTYTSIMGQKISLPKIDIQYYEIT